MAETEFLRENHYSALPQPDTFQAGFGDYLSVFTYRYGTSPMRKVWSQKTFWGNVRIVILAVAETQFEAGVKGVTSEQVDDLRDNIGNMQVERIFQIERDPVLGTGHDFAAGIAEYSENAPQGGMIAGRGMTSEDGFSNAEIMQVRDALELVRPRLVSTIYSLGHLIEKYKDLPCMGYTHLQAAEPITAGYRFALWAQDLISDLRDLDYVRGNLKGKGIKGAVGTAATFKKMLEGTGMSFYEFEGRIMSKLGLQAARVTAQTYPRKTLHKVSSMLSGVGDSLHHSALNLQLLQSSPIDEVSEKRRKGQIGSNAMPHKQNPINSENIDALTELLPGHTFAAWMTSAFETLERTLRDSAGKRSWLPESFLIIDEALVRAEKVFTGLEVHKEAVQANMNKYGPYCATETIMDALCSAGMDRKLAHALLVEHAESAHDAVRSGKHNSMRQLVLRDQRISGVIGEIAIQKAFRDVNHHTGLASEFCVDFLENELYPAVQGPVRE